MDFSICDFLLFIAKSEILKNFSKNKNPGINLGFWNPQLADFRAWIAFTFDIGNYSKSNVFVNIFLQNKNPETNPGCFGDSSALDIVLSIPDKKRIVKIIQTKNHPMKDGS